MVKRCLNCNKPIQAIGYRGRIRRFCGPGCGGAFRLKSLTPEQRAQASREGVAAQAVIRRLNLSALLIGLDRYDAIWKAYQMGYHAGKTAKYVGLGLRAGRSHHAHKPAA